MIRTVAQVRPASKIMVQLKTVVTVGRYAGGASLVYNTTFLLGVEWPIVAGLLIPWFVSYKREMTSVRFMEWPYGGVTQCWEAIRLSYTVLCDLNTWYRQNKIKTGQCFWAKRWVSSLKAGFQKYSVRNKDLYFNHEEIRQKSFLG